MASWLGGGAFGGGMPGWGVRPTAPSSGAASNMTPFNPSDPFGWLGSQYSSKDPTMAGIYNYMMGNAGKMGVFDPTGNQALMGALRQDAQRQSLGRQRSALNFARNNGIDPSAMGFAGLMAQLGGQSDLADALLNARMQSGLQNQNLLGQALMGGFGLNSSLSMSDRNAYNQQRYGPKQPSGFGGMLGSIAGAALGALIPGGGGGGVPYGGMPPATMGGSPFYSPMMR